MWRVDPAGDRALLVRLGLETTRKLVATVLSLERELNRRNVPGLLGTVPASASLLCRYDPEKADLNELEAVVRRLEGDLEPVSLSGTVVELPTIYDGEDLAVVAAATALSPGDVIRLHAEREYLVYCLGFAPGFAYCGELDRRLTVPRKATPRQRVPAGSVAIAGRQTGIYAVMSPGGWNLIGRTTTILFDPNADPPARLSPGDRVRFIPKR